MSEHDELAALLDITLDDIEDLPSFENFPVGAHRVKLTLGMKKINEHPSIEAALTYIEAIELVDDEAVAPKEGDKASLAYMMDNEFGAGKFKVIAKPLAVALGLTRVPELVEACKDIECVILTGLRTDKNDKTKKYMEIKELVID